jgi:hypothetical protein
VTAWIVPAVIVATVIACTGGATPSPTPSPTPGAVVVTIEVVGAERYKVRLTEPADIQGARDLLAGQEVPHIPNGRIVRGDADVNAGYSWHIDPDDFEWADVTTEVCDGLPSYVEDGTLTGDRFCPWGAQVVAVEDL